MINRLLSGKPNAKNRKALMSWPIAFLCAIFLCVATKPADSAEELDQNYLTNSLVVRQAFQEATSQASRSTVSIFSNGQKVSLGTVISSDGFVLTKASELKGKVQCQLSDERKLPANIVGVHMENDLALLKIRVTGLTAIKFSNNSDPHVGSWLASVGTTKFPMAVGIISVNRRKIPAERGALGIALIETKQGPKVTVVVPDGAADQAGIRQGDVIQKIDNHLTSDHPKLSLALKQYSPGDRLVIHLKRGAVEIQLAATLGTFHSTQNTSQRKRSSVVVSSRRAGFPMAIQHDSQVSARRCGGPVVDLQGNVVGINIARADRTATYLIPADQILPLLNELKSGRLAQKQVGTNGSSPISRDEMD